ncbi:odorant binding protein 7 [Halictus rubicundus]|uniref:odorant binding protein 7 n=1 Tax=Halictus rubicundus TaxID=77578 RepID=UPI00403582D2
MNSIFILACVLASCVTVRGFEIQQLADLLDLSQDDFNECVRDNDFDDAGFARIPQLLGNANLDSNEETVVNNFGCFMACVFEKGKITQDNKIQSDAVQEFIEENNIPISFEMKENIKDCIVEANKKSDKCESALAFSICIYERLFRQD